jgi:hypothetical protein
MTICKRAGNCTHFLSRCGSGTAEYALNQRLQEYCNFNHLPDEAMCNNFIGASPNQLARSYAYDTAALQKRLIEAATAVWPAQDPTTAQGALAS